MRNFNFICPSCGKSAITVNKDGTYFCNECLNTFNEDDVERWTYIHGISERLMDTDEKNMLDCEIIIEHGEAVGLSSLQEPTIVRMYQQPSEGIVWLQYYGNDEWFELDTLTTDDLKSVYLQLLDLPFILEWTPELPEIRC